MANPPALSGANVNLIFVVSEDLAYQAPGDVSPTTGNLTSQGLARSLSMGTFLKTNVLGSANVTGIYALEPMTHLQTASALPDMAAMGTIQQFAVMNQITLAIDQGVRSTTRATAPPSTRRTPQWSYPAESLRL